jgi:hypothetical protein
MAKAHRETENPTIQILPKLNQNHAKNLQQTTYRVDQENRLAL